MISMFSRTLATVALGLLLGACSYGYDRPDFRTPHGPSSFTNRPALEAAPPAMVKLGSTLFNDTGLSGDGSTSCATCHQAQSGFADAMRLSRGAGGRLLIRHTPTLYNAAYYPALFWDGRSPSLADQALRPVISGAEMSRHPAILADSIAAESRYRPLFESAFGGADVTEDRIAKAIAAYEHTIISGVAPFDRWLAGSASAISPQAERGFALFTGKAKCAACHSGWLMSDGKFHDTGMRDDDLGRGGITNNRALDHAFRTPSLREIGRTAPYMHDGSLATLEEVIDHYAKSRVKRRRAVPDLDLSLDERTDLAAFLRTLDSDDAQQP